MVVINTTDDEKAISFLKIISKERVMLQAQDDARHQQKYHVKYHTSMTSRRRFSGGCSKQH